MGGTLILGLVVIACIVGPLVASHGYADVRDPSFALQPPGRHGGLFGTDSIGRDQVARVLYGGRLSLAVGLTVVASATLLGTAIGALAGYYGGFLDTALMQLTDFFLGLPLLAVVILAAQRLRGVVGVIVILAAFFWMPTARIVRGLVITLRERAFVEAARAAGAGDARIILRHLLPHCSGPILINAALSTGAAILSESALSFLGFGIQAPVPTWGNLLRDGRRFMTVSPWLVVIPGLALVLTVLAVNLIADGLRQLLDPHDDSATLTFPRSS